MVKTEDGLKLVAFSLGHLYQGSVKHYRTDKNDIGELGWIYLQEMRNNKDKNIRQRANEMLFPYYYIHKLINRHK